MNPKLGQAWLALCCALALHVIDEAVTGFLAVYNPTVLSLRASIPWLPLPVFQFETWLTGLILAILILTALSWFVFRGAPWTRYAAFVFAAIMIANAIGHTVGSILGRTTESVRFATPMPGFYSSPFLLAASIWLLIRLRKTATA